MNHLTLVMLGGGCFLFLQVLVTVALATRCKKYVERLEGLKSQATSNAGDTGLSWFDTFTASLQNSQLVAAARDSAILHAREQVYSFAEYSILQRLGIAAPLVGVAMTAIGFFKLEIDPSNLTAAAVPLVSGVLTGAALSILNQLALLKADLNLQRCVVSSQNLINETWRSQITRMVDPYVRMSEVLGSFENTCGRFADLVGEFPKDVGALTAKFTSIGTIATATYASINKLSPTMESAAHVWQSAASRIASTVDEKFVESLRCLQSCSQTLPTFVRTLENIANDMRLTSKRFEETSQLQSELTAANTVWAKDMLTSHTRDLNASVNELAAPLSATGNALASLKPSLESSVSTLDSMAKLVQVFSNILEQDFRPAGVVINELSGCSEKLQRACVDLEGTISALSKAAALNSDVHSSLDLAIRGRAVPTVEVLQRATGSFEDAAHRLSECSEGLQMAIQPLLTSVSSC